MLRVPNFFKLVAVNTWSNATEVSCYSIMEEERLDMILNSFAL